jgi:hypothetical protein
MSICFFAYKRLSLSPAMEDKSRGERMSSRALELNSVTDNAPSLRNGAADFAILDGTAEAPEVLVECFRMKPLSQCRTLFELNPLASFWTCVENIMLAMAPSSFQRPWILELGAKPKRCLSVNARGQAAHARADDDDRSRHF